MNDRIQLLIEQATTRIDPTAHDGVCWDFDKEKFAELIVLECVRVVNAADESCEDYYGPIIREHFYGEEE